MVKKKAAKKNSRKKTTVVKKTARGLASGKLSADFQKSISQDIWPFERDILFRPDRFKYVRKLIKPDGCVFCNAAHDGVRFETLCVYQTQYSMVVLNKFPYNSGHVLILPKRHCGDMLDLSDAEFMDLQNLVRRTVKAVQEIYQPAGMNMGLNLGAVAGAGIPDHIHYHLIPRWAGDLNFFPLIAKTKVVIEDLEVTFQRFQEYFKKHEI